MSGRSGMLPGFEGLDSKPPKKRVRPKRHGFDESETKLGPNGGVLRRGKGKGRRYEDITGLKFGMWTVIEFSHYHETAHSMMWLCECECGARQVKHANVLMQRLYLGCRRCKADRMRRLAYSPYWNRLKSGAKNRGIELTIDRKDTIALLERQGFRCALTGLPIAIALTQHAHSHGGSTASLDRIDNSRGYVPGNVWWVHKDVNRFKGTMSVEKLVEFARLIVATHEKRLCQHSAG